MVYITKYDEDDACVYYSEEYIPKETSYFPLEEIPEGSGLLKTDGVSKVWWEDPPEPEPEPEPVPVPTDHEILMTLLGVTEE